MVGAPVSHPRRPESHGFSSSSEIATVFIDIFFGGGGAWKTGAVCFVPHHFALWIWIQSFLKKNWRMKDTKTSWCVCTQHPSNNQETATKNFRHGLVVFYWWKNCWVDVFRQSDQLGMFRLEQYMECRNELGVLRWIPRNCEVTQDLSEGGVMKHRLIILGCFGVTTNGGILLFLIGGR